MVSSPPAVLTDHTVLLPPSSHRAVVTEGKWLPRTLESGLEPQERQLLSSPGRIAELKLKGLLDRTGLWRSLREMKRMLNFRRSAAGGEELGRHS